MVIALFTPDARLKDKGSDFISYKSPIPGKITSQGLDWDSARMACAVR
jgi:hypothetical protein